MIRLLVSVGHQITNLPTYVFYIVNKPNLCVKLVQVVEKWGVVHGMKFSLMKRRGDEALGLGSRT